MLGKNLIQAAAGAGGEVLGVEDVFSTWLYTGNGSTQTITNGIDLSGEGGLVWVKRRDSVSNHVLCDTNRGITKVLNSNSTSGDFTSAQHISSTTSSGFTVGNDGDTNQSAGTFASWTFRKAAKFFDVVTYTGDGVAGRQIPHNLGSVPGFIIIKRTNSTSNWECYHRSLGNDSTIRLNLTNAVATTTGHWNSTSPTSSVFTVGNAVSINGSGNTYVAYLFAHDAGGFGDSGNDSVVKCGSCTGGGTVDLGWEPQWILLKGSDTSTDWYVLDAMRGMPVGGNDAWLKPNLSDAEGSNNVVEISSTGFSLPSAFWGSINGIYIAIRRGPMKTPTDATTVYATDTAGATSPNPPMFNGILTDLGIYKNTTGSFVWNWGSRMQGQEWLESNSTNAAGSDSAFKFDYQDGFYASSTVSSSVRGWMFRRAPGFFDVVAYTGTGANIALSHNLGAVPELVIIKKRSGTGIWITYSKSIALDRYLLLNGSGGSQSASGFGDWPWNNTAPTASVFNIGYSSLNNSDYSISVSGQTYIAYLFASCPGVSKVGSYTGSASDINVDCGFTNGARFVLIKRVNDTGAWFVWDTARGIASGNDPYLVLNSTAAEVTNTDYLDPYSAGFTVPGTSVSPGVNNPGDTFIFLAIA